MKFIVRYWSSLLPVEYREKDGTYCWVDYSVHPASKLGLHNALLAVHDRTEILQAHGGQFECAVFVEDGEHSERLSQQSANSLFASLPRGEVKWLDVRACLLPARPATTLPLTADDAAAQGEPPPRQAPRQLPLFAHVHTPYDDLEPDKKILHAIDLDT